MNHTELSKYFIEANNTLIDDDDLETKEDNIISEDSNPNLDVTINEKKRISSTPSYLKRFLKYLVSIGDIYYKAKEKNGCKNTNYLKMLKKYPKEIIAKLFLKYNSEQDALEISKATKSDFISVVLEYTRYFKNSVINYADFNHYFNEILLYYDNPSTKFSVSDFM